MKKNLDSLHFKQYPFNFLPKYSLNNWNTLLVASISKTYNPHSIKLDLIMESFGHLCPVIVGLWIGEIGEHYISWPDLEIRYFKDFLKSLSNVCVYKASHFFLTITCILHLILYLICELHYPANQWNSFAVFDPDVHLGSYIIGRIRGRTLLITNSRILTPYRREINKVIPVNSPK